MSRELPLFPSGTAGAARHDRARLCGGWHLTSEDAELYVAIGDGDVLRQKERLLNLLLPRLPAECRDVAWLDHAAEVAHLHHLHQPRVERGQISDCGVDVHDLVIARSRHWCGLAKADGSNTAYRR